jgi:hypothetical protein
MPDDYTEQPSQKAFARRDIEVSRVAYSNIVAGSRNALYIEDLLLLAAQQGVHCGDETMFLETARVAWKVAYAGSRGAQRAVRCGRGPGRRRST